MIKKIVSAILIMFVFILSFGTANAAPEELKCVIGHPLRCTSPNEVQRYCVGDCGCQYKVVYCGADNCLRDQGVETNCQLAPKGCNQKCGPGSVGNTKNPSNSTIENNPILNILGNVQAPNAVRGLGPGEAGLNNFIGKVIQILFIVAAIGFVFMVLFSALQMIFSGGDKEAVAKARGRLTWAILGIILLALAFVIVRFFGTIVQIDLLNPNP